MKKMIYSFVLVGLMLIGTSVSLFGQDWLGHAYPPKTRLWQSAVLMKAPPHVVNAAIEYVENNPLLCFVPYCYFATYHYTGYSYNYSVFYTDFNKDITNPPNESSSFLVLFATDWNYPWGGIIVNGQGVVVGQEWDLSPINGYDGEQFQHP